MQRQLSSHLPSALPSQIDSLAVTVIGCAQSVSAQLGKIARAMPLSTTQESKEQRLRRLLDNERITQADHYHGVVKAALQGLQGQRVHLIIDRVLVQDTHNILVVSLAFRRRSIPLTWHVLAHRGQSGFTDQQALLTQAMSLLPPGVRVCVHADSEFRSHELFTWLRSQGHDTIQGIQGLQLVAWTPEEDGRPLHKWLPNRDSVAYLEGVYLGQRHLGPVNILAWWERDDGEWIVRAVMTNLPAQWQTYVLGRRRMWIETVFRDWQSGGFHLDKSGIHDGERIARLLIPLVLTYVWFVALGRWVVKRGYRTLVDAGPARQWKYSLFQLGVAWKERMGSFVRPPPLLFVLYL